MRRFGNPPSADEMEAIARRTIDDDQVADALMPGAGGAAGRVTRATPRPLPRRDAVSIKGLTPGVAYRLADCCHPVPGDRIVGLRLPDAPKPADAADALALALCHLWRSPMQNRLLAAATKARMEP